MAGWIWRVLVGRFSRCQHEWKIIETNYFKNERGKYVGLHHALQCAHCGDVKYKHSGGVDLR